MKPKHLALVIISIALIAGCVLAAGCTSQDNKGIVGTWVSEGTYNASDTVFNQKYTFADDATGTLSAVTTEGKTIKTIQVMWAYDEDQKAYMAYTPSTGNYDYLILSDDGKTIVSEYGEIYFRIN